MKARATTARGDEGNHVWQVTAYRITGTSNTIFFLMSVMIAESKADQVLMIQKQMYRFDMTYCILFSNE
jgi:hypothetical protein